MDDWQVLKKHKYKLFFPIIVQAGELWTVLIFALGWNKSKNLKLSKLRLYLHTAVGCQSQDLPVQLLHLIHSTQCNTYTLLHILYCENK